MAGSARAVSASRFVVAGKGERAPAPGLGVADSMGPRLAVDRRDGGGDARRPLFNAALSWALSPGSIAIGGRGDKTDGCEPEPEPNLPRAEPRDLIHERGMAAIVTLASGGAF